MDEPPRTDVAGARQVAPTIHPSAVLAPGAVVTGQVTIEADCFIGPNAVLRGDIEPIVVRRGSNVQDNCTVHTERGSPVSIGPDASIGHGAVVHGATIGERALVGMNAVVLNGAAVGERAVVGALTLVPQGFQVPARSLAVGIPCQVRKQGDAVADMAFQNTERYHRYREEHLAGLWRTVRGPLNDHGSFSR
ncbi:MAG: gamma carbonic anhydrase family protein [Thermoplasmatota archaeon]|nr:gamma carbonic anhydrase family protein [Halobacteriales archaeon]